MRIKRVIILIFILLISGCSYDEYEMPKDAYIKLNENRFEVYNQDIKIYDLIKDTNVEILTKNKKIDTTKLGNNKITITYKYNKRRKYKYDINYDVIDTVKPVVLYAPESKTLYVGNEENFCENISYADNYDRNVKCSIEGDIDFNTPNTYNLKYVLTDSSNNKEEKDLVVNIINEAGNNENSDYNYEVSNVYFSDIIKNYKTDKTMIGIDVSYWQQDIDFKKVKDAGCEFVIIRIGYNTDINEEITLDSFFKQNLKNAKKEGLKVGIYLYTMAINEKDAKSQAKWIVDNLKKEKLDFPIVFDFESWSDFPNYKISTYDITNTFLTFKKYLNKHGYDAMLYSSMNYLNKVWMFNDTYDVWLAHYIDQTTYQGKYKMWQIASDGKIDGINNDVDIDIYYKEGVNK